MEARGRRGCLGPDRDVAMAKANLKQLYRHDGVKAFNRDLLRTKTLKEREEQIKQNRRIANDAKEENKKFMDKIIRQQDDVERQQQRQRQRQLDQKACAGFMRQQVRETELKRRQLNLDKQKEMEECAKVRNQYARDQIMLKQRQHEEKMNVRNAYLWQIEEKRMARAAEARTQKKEEERWSCINTEKDEWTKMMKEKEAEKYRRRERRSEMLGERLFAEEWTKARREVEKNARVLEREVTEQEAKRQQELKRKNEHNHNLRDAMAAQRESRRKEREEAAREEKRRGMEELRANKEEDRIYMDNQRLIAERKKANRIMMDNVLRQQMAEKRLKEQLEKQERLNHGKKQVEILAEHDEQFQRCNAGVINAAAEANRDTYQLCKDTARGIACAKGPITGGVRANYLVPGVNYDTPNYINRATQDINRRNTHYETTKERLGFIW